MNKFNIDSYVFFTENDILDIKAVNITLGRIVSIEKVEGTNTYLKYGVQCLYAVTHKKQKWQGLKYMSEDCLYSDFMALQCVINKTNRNYFK